MKTISVRDLQKGVKQVVDSAQTDRVVVTRRGEPAVVPLGVEGKDWKRWFSKSALPSGTSSRHAGVNRRSRQKKLERQLM